MVDNNAPDNSQAARSGGPLALRSYTMGQKIKARQVFIFNQDGTIKGVREISPAQNTALQEQTSPKGNIANSESKFGSLSRMTSQKSMKSLGGETGVVFSEQNYIQQPG